MKFILGIKKEMTQIFNPESGEVVPVTVVSAGPCTVLRVKTNELKDAYNAVVVGLPGKKKLNCAQKQQVKEFGNLAFQKEFRLSDSDSLDLKRGDIIDVDSFEVSDSLKIIGRSKGKGFQGVIKRHGFHGQSATHGNKDQERATGSIGPTEPNRVFPGRRMPGHTGNEQVTVKNLKLAKVDKQNNLLYIKGAVPGAKGGLIYITAPGELKVKSTSAGEAQTKGDKNVESKTEKSNKD